MQKVRYIHSHNYRSLAALPNLIFAVVTMEYCGNTDFFIYSMSVRDKPAGYLLSCSSRRELKKSVVERRREDEKRRDGRSWSGWTGKRKNPRLPR